METVVPSYVCVRHGLMGVYWVRRLLKVGLFWIVPRTHPLFILANQRSCVFRLM